MESRLSLFVRGRIKREIETFDPEVIHIVTEGPLGLAARRICLQRGLPFTTSYHTKFPEYLSARIPVPVSAGYKFMRWFHGPSKAVMVATPTLARELADHGFDNLRAWSRGVDTEFFRPHPDHHDYPGRGFASERGECVIENARGAGARNLFRSGDQRTQPNSANDP